MFKIQQRPARDPGDTSGNTLNLLDKSASQAVAQLSVLNNLNNIK
jgi:hypothetical protein